jgi:phosphate transport system substrate-binding protein
LRALNIEGVEPNEGTAESGEYPLSRPLFIYSDATYMTEKPQVAEFISFYLSNVNAELGTEEGQIGYFPVSVEAMNANKQLWLDTVGEGM